VMPAGFGWPRDYRLWTALQADPLAHPRGEGPGLQVVGKLAPGASLSEARAELATIGARTAAAYPEPNARLEPRAQRHGAMDLGVGELMLAAFRSLSSLAFLGLIVLVCGNVALLLFARTAARQSEIVVRGALGASRGRIVAQLFVEALVLGLLSGLAGLVVASVGYAWVLGLFDDLAPGLVGYWIDARLDPGTIAYALVFTLIAATVAGVVPALKATGRGFHARLQRVGTSGPGLEFGRLWTAIIVGQIAVTVAFVPIIGLVGEAAWEMRARPFGLPAQEYLVAELRSSRSTGSFHELGPAIRRVGYSVDFESAHAEVKSRLEREPGVSAVTVVEQVPGAPEHPARVLMEGPSAPLATSTGHSTRTVSVDLDVFDAMGVPLLAGRSFTASDDAPDARVAIVDEVFVRQVLEGRNAVGRRFQFNDSYRSFESTLDGERFEIVGVVRRVLQKEGPFEESAPYLYLPLGSTRTYPVRLAVRVGPDPTAFAARLRQIVTEVDPDLVLTEVRSLEDADWATRRSFETWFWVLLAMGGMGITLAMAGLYSIVSFTVSRRTREIGVRVALGADRLRVVSPILRRAMQQIGIGSAVGATIFWSLIMGSELRFMPGPGQILSFAIYLLGIAVVCGTACIVPARRAMAIEPTEALRAEG
jgi:putative ABC transport system permease protein